MLPLIYNFYKNIKKFKVIQIKKFIIKITKINNILSIKEDMSKKKLDQGKKMYIKSNIRLEYKNSECSEIIYKSLEVDNEGFVESNLDENIINFKIESDKLGSFLATADDLIASEILAESIIKNTNKEDF